MIRYPRAVILAVYGVSFALPAYGGVPGLGAFLAALLYLPIAVTGFILGRSPLAFAIVCLSWFANPVLWAEIALLTKERWHGAALAGFVAALLASIPLLARDFLHGLSIGYFAWLASSILLAVMSLAGWMICPSHAAARPDRWTIPGAGEVARIINQRPSSPPPATTFDRDGQPRSSCFALYLRAA